MSFDLQKLETLNDYTNASYYFIRHYNPKLLYDDEAIGIGIYAIYKAKLKLDKTQSINRFKYTKRCVYNDLHRYIKDMHIPPVGKIFNIDTPIELLIKQETWNEFQIFIDGLSFIEKDCVNLLYDGLKPTQVAVKLNLSRSAVAQIIKKIKEKWLNHVDKKEE